MLSFARTMLAVVLMVVATAHGEEPLHEPLDSLSYGFGPGVLVQEVQRAPNESRFRILRNYDYSHDASAAWGTVQNWFPMCGLREVAMERGFAQAKVVFQVPERGSFRAMRSSETFADIGKDQLFVATSWLPEDGRSIEALANDAILPLARTETFCNGFKSRSSKAH